MQKKEEGQKKMESLVQFCLNTHCALMHLSLVLRSATFH